MNIQQIQEFLSEWSKDIRDQATPANLKEFVQVVESRIAAQMLDYRRTCRDLEMAREQRRRADPVVFRKRAETTQILQILVPARKHAFNLRQQLTAGVEPSSATLLAKLIATNALRLPPDGELAFPGGPPRKKHRRPRSWTDRTARHAVTACSLMSYPLVMPKSLLEDAFDTNYSPLEIIVRESQSRELLANRLRLREKILTAGILSEDDAVLLQRLL